MVAAAAARTDSAPLPLSSTVEKLIATFDALAALPVTTHATIWAKDCADAPYALTLWASAHATDGLLLSKGSIDMRLYRVSDGMTIVAVRLDDPFTEQAIRADLAINDRDIEIAIAEGNVSRTIMFVDARRVLIERMDHARGDGLVTCEVDRLDAIAEAMRIRDLKADNS